MGTSTRIVAITFLILLSFGEGVIHSAAAHTLGSNTVRGSSFTDQVLGFFESPTDEQIVESLRRMNQTFLAGTHVNRFGVSISAYEHPSEVVTAIEEAIKLAQKSKTTEIRRSVLLRELVVNGLVLLIEGRGQSYDAASKKNVHGTGWFLANRSIDQSGMNEIQRLIRAGHLDEEGVKRLRSYLEKTDFTESSRKIVSGFPPEFTVVDPERVKALLADLGQAKVAPTYAELPDQFQKKALTLAELLEKAAEAKNLSPKEAVGLLGEIGFEKNLYDESVQTLNDPNRTFTDFFGRQKETQEVVDAFTRIDKGHILMTGKAGVGKTTILEILSDRFVQGKLSIRGGKPPIILELPITHVTNPTDPTQLKGAIAAAKRVGELLETPVILYIDEAHISSSMTMNAMKSFLTEPTRPGKNWVHLALSTTSGEARKFLSDTAFSRRFVSVHIEEFNREDTLKLIRQAYQPLWKKVQQNSLRSFDGVISDEALDYAYKYAELEQPHAGNPTGTKELLEGAIVRKLNDDQSKHAGAFSLEVEDVQAYIRYKFSSMLLPDDPEFEAKFETKWAHIDQAYQGNDAFKAEFKKLLKSYFMNRSKNRKMLAYILMGPPGAGKSYFSKLLSEAFFNGAELTINAAEYKEGGLGLNKLIGSPTGTVGSEEQRSVLTRDLSDHPYGSVWRIEEIDYAHQDVFQFLTNTISDAKFTDGLGKEFSTSGRIIQGNTNIGQELMVNPSARQAMTWEEYAIKRAQITEKVQIGGKIVDRVRPKLVSEAFDSMMEQVVTKSNPMDDTSLVAQEAQKQKRRYRAFYILPPTREELEAAGHFWVKKFIENSRLDFGVKLQIPAEVARELMELDQYDFVKAHSYVTEKLEAALESKLAGLLNERGREYSVALESAGEERTLVVRDTVSGRIALEDTLERTVVVNSNPWGSSDEMMKRIRELPVNMSRGLKGADREILEIQKSLKQKALDWNSPGVFTLLGTTGNGKTETAKVVARSLFNDPAALFTIEGVSHPHHWNDYIRPPTAFVGSNEETEFERWVKARKNTGGVILIDELLSITGLSQNEVSDRAAALNRIYELLSEQKLKIGKTTYDMRGFLIFITGNALQEHFQGIAPGRASDDAIDEVHKRLTMDEITRYFMQRGIDPPKLARLGKIFVRGPLKRREVAAVGKITIEKVISEVRSKSMRNVDLKVAPELVHAISMEKSTVLLGMRDVQKALKELITEPYTGILFDLPQVKSIEVKFGPDKSLVWYADGKEIMLAGQRLDQDSPLVTSWEYRAQAAGSLDLTPQFNDVNAVRTLSKEQLKLVTVHEFWGHWVPSTLLKGENQAMAINLEPGQGYGGYVQFRNEQRVVNTLTDLSIDAIVYEGGHRSVFLHGKYATGGGTSSLEDQMSKRSDDLAGVNRKIEQMISNHLVEGLSEFTPKPEIQAFKEAMHNVYAYAADYVIGKALASKKFDRYASQAMERLYVDGTTLDQWSRELGGVGVSRERLLSDALVYGVIKARSAFRNSDRPFPVRYLESFLSRITVELKTDLNQNLKRSLQAAEIDAELSRLKRCKAYLKKGL